MYCTFDLSRGPIRDKPFPPSFGSQWTAWLQSLLLTVPGLDFSSAAAISNMSLCNNTDEHKDQKDFINLMYHFSRLHAF